MSDERSEGSSGEETFHQESDEDEDEARRKDLARQAVQDAELVDPRPVEKVPAVQAVHALASIGENVPAEQVVHELTNPAPKVPAAQATHTLKPAAA